MSSIKGLVESLLEGKLEAIVPLLDYLYENTDPRWCSVNQAFGKLHWSLHFPSFGLFLKESFWQELNGTSQEVFDKTWKMVGSSGIGTMGRLPTEEEARVIRQAFEDTSGALMLPY